MELSQDEKDRIVAEEKLRFETVKSLKIQDAAAGGHGMGYGGGCHGQGFAGHRCHCGGIWKGMILGVLVGLFIGSFFGHRSYGPYGGHCYFGSSMMQNHESMMDKGSMGMQEK